MLDHNPLAASVKGERYEASVPDTLDLADRMGLAVNAMTNVWFPSERFALAFNVEFSRRPPVLSINHLTDAYLNIPAKFIEALVVCRLASGSRQNIEVDRGVLDAQLSFIGGDGLTYCPTDTLPELPGRRPFSEVWGEGRLLLALSMLAQVDDDPRWAEAAKRKVDRFLELSRRKDGFRFLWQAGYSPGENPPPDADEPSKPREGISLADHYPFFSIIYSTGALGHGAGLLYRVTGYEPALELSEGLAKWALARVFNREDGRWDFYHFHHSLYSLMAVCEYGSATGDRAALERVDACYRWAREMGDPLIGYFPEYMPGSDNYLERRGNTTEACEVADMLYLALCLTREGMGDYWDDVDRWIRNVHAESQMLDDGFVDAIPDDYLLSGPNPRRYLDSRDMAARSVGSFWGWMSCQRRLPPAEDGAGPQAEKKLHNALLYCQRRSRPLLRLGRHAQAGRRRDDGRAAPEQGLALARRRQLPAGGGQGCPQRQADPERQGEDARVVQPRAGAGHGGRQRRAAWRPRALRPRRRPERRRRGDAHVPSARTHGAQGNRGVRLQADATRLQRRLHRPGGQHLPTLRPPAHRRERSQGALRTRHTESGVVACISLCASMGFTASGVGAKVSATMPIRTGL